MTLHKLLQRQIQKYLGSREAFSPEMEGQLQEFLKAVSQAYEDFDADRKLLEWSQELSSRELLEEKFLAETKSKELQDLNHTLLETQEKMVSTSKMSALGEMAGGIAHEINTPLTVLQLLAENLEVMVQRKEIDKVKTIETTQLMMTTVDRVAVIVSGLRKFARNGAQDPLVPIAVQTLIDDTLSFCRERFHNNSIKLEITPCEGIKVDCRSTEISQVLLNLLNNSFDAIETYNDKWIKVDVRDLGDKVEISVNDCGPGIPFELQRKMMQPFFTTKPVGKGTGLGLSISKGIIEAHGGTLEIDQAVSHTRFVIRLPKKESHASGEPQ